MLVRHLGVVDYVCTAEAMRRFSEARGHETPDELWLCQHPPVYTQGITGKLQHVLNAGAIPVVRSTRGGQVTYHGPGQIVAYPLINLKRHGIFVREYVCRLEESAIRTLLHFGVSGFRVAGAPGVYVALPGAPERPPRQQAPQAPAQPDFTGLAKIAALGVKVTRGCTYHGLALNVHMDLAPFHGIHPCGYSALTVTDLHTIGVHAALEDVQAVLQQQLTHLLAT
ncbi:lipoyl(octanoyl) transferase LipB [Lampropedia cohaerens]|nr:lipoyl(octanoyl) transferase LipB [Lampropedia cohaerens]